MGPRIDLQALEKKNIFVAGKRKTKKKSNYKQKQRSLYLVAADGMGPIVYEKMVITVQLQEIEPQHEALQDGVRLEGDDAVQVPLVLRLQHCSIYLAVLKRQEVVLTLRRHVV